MNHTSNTIPLPDRFSHELPSIAERGEHTFPTSLWSPDKLDCRVEVVATHDNGCRVDLRCIEEHHKGYYCGARIQYVRLDAFFSKLVVLDKHRQSVLSIDALAAPHFVPYNQAPELYIAKWRRAKEAWRQAGASLSSASELLDVFFDHADDPTLQTGVAQFPWCLPLSRFVQVEWHRYHEKGTDFLRRVGDVDASVLRSVTNTQPTGTLLEFLNEVLLQLDNCEQEEVPK